jgi:ankyrin repeat protein
MSIKLNDADVSQLQSKYYYLTNFESENPSAPIDPLNYRDAGGDNLMHIAARHGDINTIKLLIGGGMCIDEQGEMGFTALHNAYQYKQPEVVDFLLAHGASTKIENNFGKLPGDYAG